MDFKLASPFQPTGDQPAAIEKLVQSVIEDKKHQVLLGVTGSGKTFTMANVIQKTKLPTLIIAHNKTLAAQLYQEFRDFFPHNAVSYFVSYYDYYQPEAYIPTTDTYIEKEATINDEIDKLRLASTTNLLTRPDSIVVASVSCIYNLGSPVEYGRYILRLTEGQVIPRESLMLQLANLQYERSDNELRRGTYRLRGDMIQLWPAYENLALRIDTLENKITKIDWIDPISGSVVQISRPDYSQPLEERHYTSEVSPDSVEGKRFIIYPAKHYVINPKTQQDAMGEIQNDLNLRLAELKKENKLVEAYRLEQKVNYDLEMIREFGFVNGIENYSRYFDGRQPGDAPFTLIDYFAENARQFSNNKFLTIIDESHITLPQIRGMYNGDQARKQTLIEYGFRLPSALDNRPLQFHEFLAKTDQRMYVSATPNEWEISMSQGEVVEQLIRPTGLIDPEVELRPIEGQIEDLVIEVIKRKQVGQRVLVTTLTKKMAEALTDYLNDQEKIDQLIKRFSEKNEQNRENVDAEKIIRANEQLPVEEMPIGKIPQHYLSKATLSEEFKKLTTTHQPSSTSYYPKVAYLHSDIETLERSDILDDLRRGTYDVLVGINLLREGLDLPEVTLVAILDADKEGFLRSAPSLIQTMGRAARHDQGHVILYADNLTGSMKKAISETQRRRTIQIEYNLKHSITPQTISKPIRERMIEKKDEDEEKGNRWGRGKKKAEDTKGTVISLSKSETVVLDEINPEDLTPHDKKQFSSKLSRRMKQAANDMDFELAALIRDVLKKLEE